ncbi:hypothetical protein [Flavobacterium sp.]|jgi:hypothetical protein|uniref:hypothetical protein n=1 Tax=Flavobacterium sp. TaxID=239 RepID=UPI0037BFE60A
MKKYFIFFLFIFLGCQKDTNKEKSNVPTLRKEKSLKESTKTNKIESDNEYLESIYNCENNKFISVLEEIPNRNSDAYKLTIISKKGNSKFTKIIDTRPKMSQIHECNNLYTEVGFPCGGPCYSRVFVFTDKNRPIEQYSYVQKVKNNSNFIAHIKNEEFEKLIIHNFTNSKELSVNISDAILLNNGQMDSLIFAKDNLVLYYMSNKNKSIVKKINLKLIL